VYPAPLACATLPCLPVLPRLKVIDAEAPERLRTFIHPPPVHIQHAMAPEKPIQFLLRRTTLANGNEEKTIRHASQSKHSCIWPIRRKTVAQPLRHLTPARSGVGSASTPAQPALDGSVPCSFLDCGHAEAQVAAPGPRRVPVAGRRAAAPGAV